MKKTAQIITMLCVLSFLTLSVQAGLCLWEVESSKSKVYLLGSIHIMPKDTYPLNEQIEKAFTASDILVVELDPQNVDQAEMNTLVMETGLYPKETTLQSKIPESLFKTLTEKFKTFGMTPEQFNRFKPWLAGLTLNMLALKQVKIEKAQGIDLHFINKAKAREKEMPILELEKPVTQLTALSSMPEDIQSKFLQSCVDDFDKVQEEFGKVLAAWKKGDTDSLDKLARQKIKDMEAELPGIITYYNALFPEREKEMLKKIATYLEDEKKQTYFVIVGAFHLVGDDGMLQALKDMGYTIRQLPAIQPVQEKEVAMAR